MRSGLLWYDKSKPLVETIQDATKRYCEKYGVSPNVCYVHPAQFAAAFKTETGFRVPPELNLTVLPKKTIVENYVWLGVAESLPYQYPADPYLP